MYLSAAQYPTIADIRFVFLGILEHLETGTSATEAVSAITSLLANYNNVTIPENHDVDDSETPHQYFQ
ncbi:hypothetical protein RCL_jg16702.t1 [Rhizophagus clarus]|uniref:Uncharacterized protein n=1 Tax=Rhizophagus clarus TaxID=94130 RepID=A0A8H3LNI7_9GLOM|nr:hypothetical protein RCL_jg16702.t1 [Rhizophagus clarus]